MIEEPITISPNATIGEADAMCARFHISGVPVVDRETAAARHHHQSRHALRNRLDPAGR
jgi:CBS domain-containing protein